MREHQAEARSNTERMQYSDHLRRSRDVLSKTRLRARGHNGGTLQMTHVYYSVRNAVSRSLQYTQFLHSTRLFASFVNKSQNTRLRVTSIFRMKPRVYLVLELSTARTILKATFHYQGRRPASELDRA